MTEREEIHSKLDKIRIFMNKNSYKGVLFGAQHNFSWLTAGGDDQIIHGTELGFVCILVTLDAVYLITNNIEMPRVSEEETEHLSAECVEFIWTEATIKACVDDIVKGGKLAADHEFSGAVNEKSRLDPLRIPLTESEVERYRTLAGICAGSMEETMYEIEPGMDEFEIQGVIGGKLLSKGIYPVVLLVGTDERIFNFRHPMPTRKKLDKYCMVVICAQKWGLVLNMTRLVHFGSLNEEIRTKYEALHKVDMAYIAATKPGNRMKDIFTIGKKAYAEVGFNGEELKHFQGGTCGYLAREIGLDPHSEYMIQDGEIFAHNPSIQGTKLEDSILVKGSSFELLTYSSNWPMREIEYQRVVLKRPEILIR